MKAHAIYALSFFFLLSLSTSAQNTVKGSIKSSATQAPLAYVSIGVVGTSQGTLTDAEGNFTITLDEKHADETLRIAMLGYRSRTYKGADFRASMQQNPVVALEEEVQQLQEVVIANRKPKEKVLGNTTTSNVGLTFSSDQLGNEMGVVIKVKKSPAYLKSFSTHIVANEYDSIKFRLNIYTLKEGMPDKSLLRENIIITCRQKSGPLTVDLSRHHLVVEDDFFVSLEWLESLEEGGIRFSTSMLGSPTIVKMATCSEWAKLGLLSLGFNVTAEQ